ncbi:hypothetical protein [Ruegeria sp. Ofav3-42]|uniref:hypothetical protein n=1 Tax=Ruegeria sp. Ofav3-42 TaxID=2917759 RepID=UPI001EF424DB|nr:hypothetical protein [Ruegeria sp. Ofav3-42]MCG7519110.1 hypothetical protein [Ruegeria sp. Ofav3-42]
MNQTRFISLFETGAAIRGVGDKGMRMRLNEKGGAWAADAVYTCVPTQPQFAQAHGLSFARGKRNTHGVRTNG